MTIRTAQTRLRESSPKKPPKPTIKCVANDGKKEIGIKPHGQAKGFWLSAQFFFKKANKEQACDTFLKTDTFFKKTEPHKFLSK